MVVLDLCGRLISKTPKEGLIRYSFWGIFAVTYLAAQLAVLLECRPFYLYWQIYPDPGKWSVLLFMDDPEDDRADSLYSVNGNAWLITYGKFSCSISDMSQI